MIITYFDWEKPIAELQNYLKDLENRRDQDDPFLIAAREDLIRQKQSFYQSLTPWQHVQIARHPQRPYFLDYVKYCFSDFIELHGDRLFGDDKSMPAGLASILGEKCVLIGQQKGRNIQENVMRNFGSPHPEGYRKALRLMRLAEKFSLPIITMIDTPGAYPGIGAEERHIAESIAVNLREMMLLKTPIITIVIGEGGSGGALGIGIGDSLFMLEHSYYSVISPEGCAAILWKHRKYAPEAALALKLTAKDLLEVNLIDGIIEEPVGGAHHNPNMMFNRVSDHLFSKIQVLKKYPLDRLLEERYNKFRNMGVFQE